MKKQELDIEIARKIIDFLNRLIEIDKDAVEALIGTRVPCNRAMQDHPTVQVAGTLECPEVGFLGIINGLCGIKPNGYALIVAHYEDGPILDHFELDVSVDA